MAEISASADFAAGPSSMSATADVPAEVVGASFAAVSATMSATLDSGDPDVVGPTGDIDPPLFVGALRFRGEGFRVWAGTNEAEIDLSGIATPTWAQVLAAGNTSGANNPSIASGQHLAFAGGGILAGDVRGASGLRLTATTGHAVLSAADTVFLQGNSRLSMSGSVDAQLYTAGFLRLHVDDDGAWLLGTDPGDAREVITSGGSGTPPTWSYPVEVRDSGSDQGDVFAFDFVAGTNINLAASVSSGVATITPSVDLSGVTYTAGDGLDLTTLEFSVDVSDFAGSGLEDDGSNNLRIAAAAAGNGLTGGGGSALAVGGSTSVIVGANDVQRAALTGAIAVSQNSNSTVFSGIRANGVSTTDRANLNFVDQPGLSWTAVDDSVNNEIEIRPNVLGSFYAENSAGSIQTPFVSFDSGTDTVVDVEDNTGGSGYVNISYDVNKTSDFDWTGNHAHTGSNFTVDATATLSLQGQNDVDLTAVGGGLALNAGHALASPSVTNGDVVTNASRGVVINANASTTESGASALGNVEIKAAASVTIDTGGTRRIEVDTDGAILLASDPGDAGQTIVSAGASAPTVWGTPAQPPATRYSIRDDFSGGAQGFTVGTYGETGWRFDRNTDAGETATGIDSEANHPGIVQLQLAATSGANNMVWFYRGINRASTNDTYNAIRFSELQRFEWIVRAVQSDSRVTYQVGFFTDPGVPTFTGVSALYFTYDTNTSVWSGTGRTSAGATDTANIASYTANTWVRLTATRQSSTSWLLQVDGNAGVVFDAELPAASDMVAAAARIRRIIGSSAHDFDLDYFSADAECSR